MSRPVRRSRIGAARSALLLCFACVLLAAGRPTLAGAEPLILDVVHADPLLDGQVLMSPVIREPIMNGVVQVSGHFTLDEAADLAARLTAGTSKIEVELVAD
jgi:SecD-like export protein